MAAVPRLFELRLPDLPLRHGGRVRGHRARGFWWGPEADLPALAGRAELLGGDALTAPPAVVRRPTRGSPSVVAADAARLDPAVPTVLLVHALTGDARVGGPAGWWGPLVGPGRVLDPDRVRILCFNNLGSNYGSSGPLDAGWPDAARLSTIDQAQALWAGLDALGVDALALVAGGSLGGMIAQAVAAARRAAVARLVSIGAGAAASPWVIGLSHVQRQAIRLDPGFPTEIQRGLEVARQLAMLTYRSEPGLLLSQPRLRPPAAGHRFAIESYLEHQGRKLRQRFDGRAYLALLDAMDGHDLTADGAGDGPSLRAVRARSLLVDIDSDVLFTPAAVDELAAHLRGHAAVVERATLTSPHGHDAFLIEWEQMAALLARGLAL